MQHTGPQIEEKYLTLLIVTKNINQNCIIAEDCYDLSSDHSPIIVTIGTNTLKTNSVHRLTSNRTDWNQYRHHFNMNCNRKLPLRNLQDIDTAIDHLTYNMTDAAKKSIPHPQEKVDKYSISAKIKDLLSKKRYLRKRYQQTRSPNDKSNFNRATKYLKKALILEKEEGLQNYLRRLSPTKDTDYSLWKATKKLKQPKRPQPPIRHGKGPWARSNEERLIFLPST